MAEKLLKPKVKRRIAPGGMRSVASAAVAATSSPSAITLVGTYKDKQLAWIRRHGLYNYPIRGEVVGRAGSPLPAGAADGDLSAFGAKVGELWLYADAKGRRHALEVTDFVGVQTRAEFLAANPTYPKAKAAHAERYLVFRTKPLDYGPRLDGSLVVARAVDFTSSRTAKIAKAIAQYERDGRFAPLEAYLPADLATLPRTRLRVCEVAVQLEFLNVIDREDFQIRLTESVTVAKQAQRDGMLTCLEICAGAGGQAIGLERAGFKHVALVEYESEYCDVLKSNNPNWNVICADVHKFDGKPYAGVDLLAGGVPCPPFSVASKQLGKDDERDLFPEAIRLIGEIQPKAVMIENVRGLLDPKFDEYRNLILQRIDALGYDVQIKLLHASDFGVPQIRPRVVIVGIRKSLRKKFEYPSALPMPAPTVGEALGDLMAANGWRGVDAWKRQANAIAPTIVGGSKKHGGPDLGPTRARRAWAALSVDGLGIANEAPTRDFEGNPRLTKEMIAVIQGFPLEWDFGRKKTAACRMIGNAFPPPVAMAVGRQIMRCLKDEK